MGYTVSEILQRSHAFFKKKGIPSARLDAELLFCDVLKIERIHLYTGSDRPLQEDEVSAYRALIKRRSEGESVAHILGHREFYGLNFIVNTDALVPRPESEHLVDEVLARVVKDASGVFIDIGTGTGALALAILSQRPNLRAVLCDLSSAALQLAKENAEQLGFTERCDFREGSLLKPCSDIKEALFICSNPPYIRKEEAKNLPEEVRNFDPHMALFGLDTDGLGHHREILIEASTHLKVGGFCVLECGHDQSELLKEMDCLWATQRIIYKDLAGHGRGLVFES